MSHPRTHRCGQPSHMFHIFSTSYFHIFLSLWQHWMSISLVLYASKGCGYVIHLLLSSLTEYYGGILTPRWEGIPAPEAAFRMNPSQINIHAVQRVRAACGGVRVVSVVVSCAPTLRVKAETEIYDTTADVPRWLQSNEEGVDCSSKDNTIHIYILIITRYQINSVQWNICLKLLQSALILN